jgi:hypothetical protein
MGNRVKASGTKSSAFGRMGSTQRAVPGNVGSYAGKKGGGSQVRGKSALKPSKRGK